MFLFIGTEYNSITRELCGNLWTTKVFLYKFDISQGYHHIDIDENDKK